MSINVGVNRNAIGRLSGKRIQNAERNRRKRRGRVAGEERNRPRGPAEELTASRRCNVHRALAESSSRREEDGGERADEARRRNRMTRGKQSRREEHEGERADEARRRGPRGAEAATRRQQYERLKFDPVSLAIRTTGYFPP